MPRHATKVIPDVLPFNPATVGYQYRYSRNGHIGKNGEKLYGPYWYAYWYEGNKFTTYYLGKELPDQCKPYTKDVKLRPYVNTRFMLKPLVEKLEEGDQLIIQVQEIANACGGYYKSLGNDEYLIYK